LSRAEIAIATPQFKPPPGTPRPGGWPASWRALAFLPAALILASALHRCVRAWNDFSGYIDAGKSLAHGTYSLAVSNTWPPFLSLVAIPISWLDDLPPEPARIFWAVLTSTVFIAAAWSWWSRARPAGTPSWVAPAAALVIAPFGLHHIIYHQIYALIFACATVGFLDASEGRDLRAGFWIGLGAAIKVTPGLTLIYFALCRRWKVVAAGAATLALCSLALVPILGAQGVILAYQRWLGVISGLGGPHGVLNQGLPAQVDRLFTDQAIRDGVGIPPIVALPWPAAETLGRVSSMGLFFALAGLMTYRRVGPLQAFAPLIAASVYVAPYCWRSQFIAFLPLLLLTFSWLSQTRDRLGLALVAPFILLMPQREPWLFGWKAYTLTEGIGFTSLGLLLLLINAGRFVGVARPSPGLAPASGDRSAPELATGSVGTSNR
jgi:hypothetical protein